MPALTERGRENEPAVAGNQSTVFSGDLCPHDGGIDQNIYGDRTP